MVDGGRRTLCMEYHIQYFTPYLPKYDSNVSECVPTYIILSSGIFLNHVHSFSLFFKLEVGTLKILQINDEIFFILLKPVQN